MEYLLSKDLGWAIIMVYGILTMLMAYIFTSNDGTKKGFYLAGKRIKPVLAAFSIASSWIWAPALFVSAQKAYTDGVAGLFWFLVPNIATLLLFASLGIKLRKRMPDGYTLTEYIRKITSNRVHNIYLVQFLGLNVCSFAVQLLAGGLAIHFLTGISMAWVAIAMSGFALAYTLHSGLKSSILTDFIQMGLMIVAILVVIPAVLFRAESGALMEGIRGVSGEGFNLFSKDGLWVAYSFGISSTIGLISGSIGDQTYWQRALAIGKDKDVKKAFYLGAFIFALIPLSLSVLGFVARSQGIEVTDKSLVNIITVSHYVGTPLLVLFLVMIISGLISTLDSVLNSVSSIAGEDFINRFSMRADPVHISMVAIILTAIAGTLIALIPGIKILHLFLFYGTLRATTLFPTIYALTMPERLIEKYMFYGLLISILIFVPVFGFGNFMGYTHLMVFGAIMTVGSSGIISIYKTK